VHEALEFPAFCLGVLVMMTKDLDRLSPRWGAASVTMDRGPRSPGWVIVGGLGAGDTFHVAFTNAARPVCAQLRPAGSCVS
jgi:hypothetical protein